MRVIGTEVLERFVSAHAGAAAWLGAWVAVATQASWSNIAEVRKTYPHADYVEPYTVFNVKGNVYRLITSIDYSLGLVIVEQCLTHSEYDKGRWKK